LEDILTGTDVGITDDDIKIKKNKQIFVKGHNGRVHCYPGLLFCEVVLNELFGNLDFSNKSLQFKG